jgi:hypothetical protein
LDVDRLLYLATTPKSLIPPPDWTLPSKDERLARWVAQIVVGDAPVPGFVLEVALPFARVGETDGLKAMMFLRTTAGSWTLGRIEFPPAPPHRNARPALMRDKRFAPFVEGCHAHLARDNARLGIDAFGPESLPAAIEIDWKGGLREAIATIEALFCIEGLWCGEVLPWDRRLL